MSNELESKPTPSQAVVYQIRIKGHLDRQWTHQFEGLTITLEEDGNTLLSGPVVDQAALHGLLKKVRDLGMPLVSVSQAQFHETHPNRSKKEKEMNTNRKTAIIVGVLYIIGTVAGVLGMVVGGRFLNAPDLLKMVAADPGQIGLVGFFVLVMGLPLAMVPAMMFPILKRQNEALAVGYVIFRGALEALTYFALAMCWLLVIVVAQQYAVSGPAVALQISSLGPLLLKAREPILWVQDIFFGVGALMFYFLLYQTRLIPRWISGWGFVGAILYGAAGMIAVFTSTHLVPLLLPLGLQEMVMAVWLIVKGFNPFAITSLSAKTATNEFLSAA